MSLAIEILFFAKKCTPGKKNLLLLDEPDVHLHPDMQVRLAKFIYDVAIEHDFLVVIATHSTAMVGAISDNDCAVAFLSQIAQEAKFLPVDEIMHKVLPTFGAHPLSNLFNDKPILIVEGDDDVRIWEQVVRSTSGQVKAHPCAAGSVEGVTRYETWLIDNMPSLYDDPVAYSLRDGDDKSTSEQELDDRSPITRMKLKCRSAENLLLADETLDYAGTDWNFVRGYCDSWLSVNAAHPKYGHMQDFQKNGYNRKHADLKDIRNIILAGTGSIKPWEVLVGQTIANTVSSDISDGEMSIRTFLGEKVCRVLLKLAPISGKAPA